MIINKDYICPPKLHCVLSCLWYICKRSGRGKKSKGAKESILILFVLEIIQSSQKTCKRSKNSSSCLAFQIQSSYQQMWKNYDQICVLCNWQVHLKTNFEKNADLKKQLNSY